MGGVAFNAAGQLFGKSFPIAVPDLRDHAGPKTDPVWPRSPGDQLLPGMTGGGGHCSQEDSRAQTGRWEQVYTVLQTTGLRVCLLHITTWG